MSTQETLAVEKVRAGYQSDIDILHGVSPLIAVLPIQSLHLYLAKYGEWDMVIYAFLVIVLMRAQIGGVAALMRRVWRPGR
jgi:hypothetical protein